MGFIVFTLWSIVEYGCCNNVVQSIEYKFFRGDDVGLLRCGHRVVDCRGLIFDKDGTLIDSLLIWPKLIRVRTEILQSMLGLSREISDKVQRVMGLDERGRVILRSPIVIGSREQTAAAVNGVLFLDTGINWDEGMEAILRAFAQADDELGLEAQAIPVPGIKEALGQLAAAGFKIAVATNDSLERTKRLLHYAGIAAYVSAYACRDEVKEGKPAPDLIKLAANRLEINLNECVMVGDALLDMQMARNAGNIKLAVGVLTGASVEGDLKDAADVILPSASSLCPAAY